MKEDLLIKACQKYSMWYDNMLSGASVWYKNLNMLSGTQDEDKDSKLSLDDYKSAVLKERLLIESFGPCLPSRQVVCLYLFVWCTCMCRASFRKRYEVGQKYVFKCGLN